MTEETSDVRARGQESQQQPHEEVTLQTLMDFMRENFAKQKEMFAEQMEMFDKHFAKQNERFDKFSEKLDSYTDDITQLRTDIREHTNTWNNNKNEVEKKQEEEVNKSYEEVRKVRDSDNAVDFTDVLATKKLATVGSNESVSSKPRNRWIKKRNDFVSLYLMTSEDDYPDMDINNKSLILSNRMHKKHKLYRCV